jgi:hypothetical protein
MTDKYQVFGHVPTIKEGVYAAGSVTAGKFGYNKGPSPWVVAALLAHRRKIPMDEVTTVVTLQEMKAAYWNYVRARKLQFSSPRSHERPIKEHWERKIEHLEMQFPAFKPAYEEDWK